MDALIGVKHMPFMHILNFIYARKASQIKVRKLCKNFYATVEIHLYRQFFEHKTQKYCGANPTRYHWGLPCQLCKQIEVTLFNCGRSQHLSEVKKSFANELSLLRKSKFLPESVLEQCYF